MSATLTGYHNFPVVNLCVYNSISRKKEEFRTISANQIKWYSCGPTVYDSAHMGHARTYISFDIIRRILEDYFGYDVIYCMNITDIDDKIIKRARERFLFESYSREDKTIEQIAIDLESALQLYSEHAEKEEDCDKIEMHHRIIKETSEALKNWKTLEQNHTSKQSLLDRCREIFSFWLDFKFGSDVADNSVFMNLPKEYETEFHQDMKALNIKPPSVLTRVSEYIPEIIEFIQKIVQNGFAYVSNSSVYFNTVAFGSSGIHRYGKLVPEAVGNLKALNEGEGQLSCNENRAKEKRNVCDFALWKVSKSGEPFWDSPWGKGRPGWHIECSVMASKILGEHIDIHSGGVDLKFPHHDNEIAQSEAAFQNDCWIHYFLHSGHLTIQGCKMSKSLKNFITIKDSLKTYTARQIRFLFLLHPWKETLDFSDNTMQLAKQYEKCAYEFFLSVEDFIRTCDFSSNEAYVKWRPRDCELNRKFHDARISIHKCLCDSFDTPGVMEQIRSLISACNIYMNDAKEIPNLVLLKDIAIFIHRIFKVFGLITDDDGFSFSAVAQNSTSNEKSALPYLQLLADFRRAVRNNAIVHKSEELLRLCDELRDVKLVEFGVRLEDSETRTVVKFCDKETLIREAETVKQESEARKEKERRMKEEAELLKASRDSQRRIPPSELFINETDKYSKFDAKGFPIQDKDGNPLTKSAIKKLSKLYHLQEKRYNEWLNLNIS